MSAHYKPYTNEPDAEQLDWASDSEAPSRVATLRGTGYRWTTRTLVAIGTMVAVLSMALGLSIGFFAVGKSGPGSAGYRPMDTELRLQAQEALRISNQLFQTIDGNSVKAYLRRFSRRPRVAGTTGASSQATELRDSWTALGLDRVDMVTYTPLLSYPDPAKPNRVRIVDTADGRQVFAAQVLESPEDPSDIITAYAAYSAPGDVKGPLIYCNYGEPGDFALLIDKFSLNLTSKILLMRLGMNKISHQVRIAQRLGAASVILYPDPQDFTPQGPSAGTFPESWWLPGNAIPRGSALDAPEGDPLTPGYPATDLTNRLSADSAELLPKIPVQMISYNDAYSILRYLSGHKAPPSWQGGFNITYKVGPNLSNTNWSVQVQVHNSNKIRKIFNVIGHIKGRSEPDRYVIIGNHRDAWVYGAADSASGTAVQTEIIRAFGRLSKLGWRPRRTLVFCSWDAEEFNVIGSAEWIEENVGILRERAVAYVNLDAAVTGNHSLSASSSPLLYQTVYHAAQRVLNPGIHGTEAVTVYDNWVRAFPTNRNSSTYFLNTGSSSHHLPKSQFLKDALENERPRMRRLSGGTDHSVFINYAGIPAVDLSYAYILPGAYPLYHTSFDNFYAIENFVDPTFKYHETVARVVSEVIRDLSDSIFIPFNVLYYTKVLKDLFQSLQLRCDLIPQIKRDMEQRAIRIDWIKEAVHNFTVAALEFHARQETLDTAEPLAIRRINDKLMFIERAFLDDNGLPGQPMHRHIVLGPSRAHTFGDESFPALMDLLTEPIHSDPEAHWFQVKTHISALLFVIQSATKTLSDFV